MNLGTPKYQILDLVQKMSTCPTRDFISVNVGLENTLNKRSIYLRRTSLRLFEVRTHFWAMGVVVEVGKPDTVPVGVV